MGWLRVGEVESLSDFLYCMWGLFREHLVGGQCALLQKNWHRDCAVGLEKGRAYTCAPLGLSTSAVLPVRLRLRSRPLLIESSVCIMLRSNHSRLGAPHLLSSASCRQR